MLIIIFCMPSIVVKTGDTDSEKEDIMIEEPDIPENVILLVLLHLLRFKKGVLIIMLDVT